MGSGKLTKIDTGYTWYRSIVAMRNEQGFMFHSGTVYCSEHEPTLVFGGLHVSRASSPDGCYACQ